MQATPKNLDLAHKFTTTRIRENAKTSLGARRKRDGRQGSGPHRLARQVQKVLDVKEVRCQDKVKKHLVLNLNVLFVPSLPAIQPQSTSAGISRRPTDFQPLPSGLRQAQEPVHTCKVLHLSSCDALVLSNSWCFLRYSSTCEEHATAREARCQVRWCLQTMLAPIPHAPQSRRCSGKQQTEKAN